MMRRGSIEIQKRSLHRVVFLADASIYNHILIIFVAVMVFEDTGLHMIVTQMVKSKSIARTESPRFNYEYIENRDTTRVA